MKYSVGDRLKLVGTGYKDLDGLTVTVERIFDDGGRKPYQVSYAMDGTWWYICCNESDLRPIVPRSFLLLQSVRRKVRL